MMTDLCPAAVQTTHWKGAQPTTMAEASLKLLKEKRLCDVIFSFENSAIQIEAHQVFLRARSPVFDSILRGRGSSEDMRNVKIHAATPERFEEFLEFIYGDKFSVDFSAALDLLHLAHEYKVEPLILKCKEVLLTELKIQDALKVFQCANKLGNLDDLKQNAGNILARSLCVLHEDKQFLKEVEEETLMYVLSKEKLPMREVDLFKLTLRWGRARLPREAVTDNEALKNIVAKILPLLRYTTMTSKEIASDVVPTKLLSLDEAVDVYSYLCGNSAVREKMLDTRKFNTLPRRTSEGVVVFVHEEGSSVGPKCHVSDRILTESLGFYASTCITTDQSASFDDQNKKLAITGIIVQWPDRQVSLASSTCNKVAPNFQVYLFRFRKEGIRINSADCWFEITMENCSPGKVVEVNVIPPMELLCPRGYCVCIEDKSDSFYRDSQDAGHYYYSWQSELQELKDSVYAEFEHISLELKDIHSNADIWGFPDGVYDSVRTIRGIRIASI